MHIQVKLETETSYHWQGCFTCKQHTTQTPSSCSPPSFFQPPSRRKHWKQCVTEGWSLLTVGSSGIVPQTAPHSTMLVCIVSYCLLEIMHSQLHGKQKLVGGHREPHGFSVLIIWLVNHSDCLLKHAFIVPFIPSFRQGMDVISCVPGCHANGGHWACWCTLYTIWF